MNINFSSKGAVSNSVYVAPLIKSHHVSVYIWNKNIYLYFFHTTDVIERPRKFSRHVAHLLWWQKSIAHVEERENLHLTCEICCLACCWSMFGLLREAAGFQGCFAISLMVSMWSPLFRGFRWDAATKSLQNTTVLHIKQLCNKLLCIYYTLITKPAAQYALICSDFKLAASIKNKIN